MKVSKYQLDNGLNILNISDKDSNSMSVMVLVRVGSRYEDEKISGLAHFVEHNFFKGTKSLPNSKDVAMAIENLGGSTNAFTSYDYTGYYIKVPKENYAKAIQIMSDMINNSLFPKEEIEKERGVIIEEIRMYEDIPMRKVSQEYMTDIFGSHPLGIDIAGSVDSVSKLSREDIINFTEKYYTGENMLVVSAGGLDDKEVESIIKDAFGSIERGRPTEIIKFNDKDKPLGLNFIEKSLEQTHLVLGGFGIKRASKERFALNLGLTILGKGFGSLLFQEIREKHALAYYVGIDHNGFEEIGAWDISMGVDNKRVKLALEAVLNVLKGFKAGKNFSDGDFDRAKNYLIGNLVTDLETSDDLAFWYGSQELLNNEVLTVDEVKEKIKKLKKEDVLEVWDKLINPNLQITAISPLKDIKEIEGIRDILK